MTVKFQKYQGTGNDFIMIDNRYQKIKLNQSEIARLCHRKFGIGANGLIYLQEKTGYDFEMIYFNSDGNESSMCCNGGRCLIRFAKHLGLISSQCKFMAIDGEHEGEILNDELVSLKMKNVDEIHLNEKAAILNTGSPHYVALSDNVSKIDIIEEARKIRYSEMFAKEGININFVEQKNENTIYVRTYERGVEDETLSCGTGVVAACLATVYLKKQDVSEMNIETLGGKLRVKFAPAKTGFENIFLIGPAEKVFEGMMEI